MNNQFYNSIQISFMVKILTALAYCVGISLAAQFPAGIDPRLCPNYPQCDNAILAAFSKNPLPFMTQGKQNGKDASPEIDHFFFLQPGYPVGLSRIQCPNYPFCH
ncbi:uncharacterized protein [Rhodnius prolixus]|uniref:uncharacterized protein n=1 Tax=Rhodnius prolixus TaxID=13249 RepID=UPI003D187BA6